MVASSGVRDFLHILPNPTNMLDLHQSLLIHLAQTMTRTGPPRHAKRRRYRLLREFNIIFSARVMLHIYPACMMYALQSAVVIVLNAIVIMKLGVIVVENATSLFTRNFLILLNTSSAGFRSGLYRGGAGISKVVRSLQIKDTRECARGVYSRQCAAVKTTCGIKMRVCRCSPVESRYVQTSS